MNDHMTDLDRLQPMTLADIPGIVCGLQKMIDYWTGEGWTYDHGGKLWRKAGQYMSGHVAILEYQRVRRGEGIPF